MTLFNSILLLFMAFTASTAFAHQVELDEHVELIPIPPYHYGESPASGANALIALNELLDSLPAQLQAKLRFTFDAPERHQWSNLPAGPVPRHGVNLSAMSDDQRRLLFTFLSSSLSETGYTSIAQTMAAEAFLSNDAKATKFKWAPENFWLAIYGEPSTTTKWAWSFSGHHLAVNITVSNNKVISMSPHFVGIEPSRFTYNGVEIDAMIDLQEAGYAIYRSLNDDQQQTATLIDIPREVLSGPKKDSVIPNHEGIRINNMTAEQQALVLDAVKLWLLQQPHENSYPSMEKIHAELNDSYFIWGGEVGILSDSYFRIQGPSIIIELLGGMRTVGETARNLGHFHTIYRNLSNDYGHHH